MKQRWGLYKLAVWAKENHLLIHSCQGQRHTVQMDKILAGTIIEL